MNHLVLCPCSHPLDRHGEAGCGGDLRSACYCPLPLHEALNAAIERARIHPWGVAASVEPPSKTAAFVPTESGFIGRDLLGRLIANGTFVRRRKTDKDSRRLSFRCGCAAIHRELERYELFPCAEHSETISLEYGTG
jgi:hypothetical protein